MIFDNHSVSEGVYKAIETSVHVKKILCWSYLDNTWMIIINKNKNNFQSAYMYIICINIERGMKFYQKEEEILHPKCVYLFV